MITGKDYFSTPRMTNAMLPLRARKYKHPSARRAAKKIPFENKRVLSLACETKTLAKLLLVRHFEQKGLVVEGIRFLPETGLLRFEYDGSKANERDVREIIERLNGKVYWATKPSGEKAYEKTDLDEEVLKPLGLED